MEKKEGLYTVISILYIVTLPPRTNHWVSPPERWAAYVCIKVDYLNRKKQKKNDLPLEQRQDACFTRRNILARNKTEVEGLLKRIAIFPTPAQVRELLGNIKIPPDKSVTIVVPPGKTEEEVFDALKQGRYSTLETHRVIFVYSRFG